MATKPEAAADAKFVKQEMPANGEWSEEQLEEGLKHLKLLHIKCRELRTSMPRMLDPLTTQHASNEELAVSFTKAVGTASRELSDFRTLYQSNESKQVLEHANKSRAANPEDIKPWRPKDHPDWLELDQ
ncbi:hypothetical protein PG995_002766 [Apiospora arundinis]|uniref:Uncharacterized protein n=1 Tax=Apiospora arundinis TaxID=335852 RepID=A0ABR2J4N4_9PEZI